MEGIFVSSTKSKIWNNDIRLGIDPLGLQNDSASGVSAIIGSALTNLLIENNSIYIGGKGFSCTGIECLLSGPGFSIATNNIIQIDRINTHPSVPHKFIVPALNNDINGKNIWYAASDSANVSSLLKAHKLACNCDASSFVANPQFINPIGDSANYNFALNTGSAADAGGTPSLLPITKDINNLNRNSYSPVDIGSHAATPCATGPTPQINLTSPVSDTVRICAGNTVSLTASINGGSFQSLQWQKNFADSAGATGTSLVVNSQGVYRLVGKNPCSQVVSRPVFVIKNPGTAQPSVSILASANTICAGASVVFVATPVNPGLMPVYQWQINGANVGTNSTTFTSTALANNNDVTVTLTNPTTCAANPTVTSNTVTMSVNPIIFPSLVLSGNTVVPVNSNTTLQVTPTNGGAAPLYQWQDSTNTHGWQEVYDWWQVTSDPTGSTYHYMPPQYKCENKMPADQ